MPIVTADLIGRYTVGDEAHFLPLSIRELSRASEFAGCILDTAAIAPGRAVLLVCQFEEAAQFVPIEEALTERGLILTNAEASIFDGARALSVLRRFDVACVIGINAALLDSMMALDADITALLKGRIVWARRCAYERLAALTGFTLLRYLEVGPALGLECIESAGAHIDAREWELASIGGEIRVSSRLARVVPLEKAPTGVFARIQHSVCACGLSDPRVCL